MKKTILTLLTIFYLTISCKNDSDPCTGVESDIISQIMVVEITDVDGANLIENGTYNAKSIYTELNGSKIIPAVYDEIELPGLPEELKNVVIIQVFDSGPDDQNSMAIFLNDQEVDMLSMQLAVQRTGCSGTFYDILEVTYNQEKIIYEDLNNNFYRITVVK